jgi:hypothetical protein
MGWADYLSDLEPSDIYNLPAWALRKTLPQDQEGNLHFGLNDPVVQKYIANEMPYAGIGMGFTKIVGPAGGSRLIQAFHDKTGQLLGSLGYKDFPGKGAVFQSIESQSPRGTAELLGRFRDEMGPLMNDVKVPGPIKAQSVPAFESWVNRGRLDPWPDLKQRFSNLLEDTRNNWADVIPENTYQWNKTGR